ncbi:hypothetical protein [Anabaena sp. 4-3]|uniref:hypothetical protein n=1 Tax=Anabaena sp. 4-3 TaxID=1811979 RepID=UPI0008312371|nr:hypothetical protein [Anabaena sp. 4-3]
MIEIQTLPFLILLVGAVITIAILTKAGMSKIGLPALVGYILLGFLFRLLDAQFPFLSPQVQEIFEFLAELGVISFR